MKVALVQDWLTELGGAEHVFRAMLEIYPDADVVTLTSHQDVINKLGIEGRVLKESFISKLPWGRTKYRNYLQLFPKAIESIDLSNYDVIISSSSSVAKGVLTHSNQLHICYCHSPVRYAWDLYHQYLKESGLNKKSLKGWYARHILHKLRIWDVISANRVDYFIANSNFIKRRITKIYRRDSEVIYPPVHVDNFSLHDEKEDYYFTASRMVPYKKIDIIVEAFSKMPDKRLIVAGTGPDFNKIKKLAGANVEILGFVSDERMVELMQKAKAFVFAANEDFGIIPVEAQACGTPVIAFGSGGSLETVKENVTGYYFNEQSSEAIVQCVLQNAEKLMSLEVGAIRKHAETFAVSRFKDQLEKLVEEKYNEMKSK